MSNINKIVCDRCKKTIRVEDGTINLEDIYEISASLLVRNSGEEQHYGQVDLCVDCERDFYVFLKGEAQNENP